MANKSKRKQNYWRMHINKQGQQVTYFALAIRAHTNDHILQKSP